MKTILFLVIAAAMLLRFMLAWHNREANDNHVQVVSWIADRHELPQKNDCWSCYQPKLYYVISAGIVNAFHVKSEWKRIRTMQLFNVFVSLFILLLFWKFIDKQKLSDGSKLLLLAFFAFNPCLAGINAQGTNDTLVIFFGTLALYACASFFREMKPASALVLTIALIAGALTKSSSLVLTATIGCSFLLWIFAEPINSKRRVALKYFSILFISFLAIVPFAGGYYHNFKNYDSLTISTWKKDPPPHFFKTTHVERPGLQNMFTGFFTFRYFDMLRQPYINNEWNNYPLHRTSLWSQLYGRTMFMHFDQWPPSWQSHDKIIVGIGRSLLLLGIVPLALFLFGLTDILAFGKNLLERNKRWLSDPSNYLHLVVTIAFLASSMLYTFSYRDFSSMKSLYIFPGLISFIKLFTDGFAKVKSKPALPITEIVLGIIILLSIANIVFLIQQLSR